MFFIFFPLFLLANIKEEIIKFYKSHYPPIIIKKITTNKELPKIYNNLKIMLNPNSYSGIIKVDNKYFFVKIDALLPVFVATKIIMPNEPIILNQNCKKKQIKFKYLYTKPIFKIQKDLVAAQIISKDSILTIFNTKKAPAVFKNSKVKVIIHSDSIEITSTAKALQNGDIGKKIQIEMNGKIFDAKVIEKGVVSLE